ncbi:MAG TPA: PAS domain S-box protein, partial [Thermoanaerobaculia bacterium]|nr:PAS domain S-box protein [Thermoanaerobaculia bacterium]
MHTPLRVLVVAASPADAESLLEELRRAGREVSWELARDAAEMEPALEKPWDLVLVDERVTGVGALSAKAIESPKAPPFLIVCGAAGECDGNVLERGTDHSLPKTTLPQLAVRVERELAAAKLRRERRMANETLRESESRFRALVERASDAIFTADPDGVVIFANRAAARVFGHPIAAMIGLPVERLVPGLLRLAAPEQTRSNNIAPLEGMGIHSSGRSVPLELSVAELQRNGRRLLTIVARDVSERRRAEDALKDSEARKSAVIEAALDAIVTIDAGGRVLEFNSAAERIFGYSRHDALGKLMSELIVPPSLRESHRQGMARYLATGAAPILGKTLEMTAMRSDGSEIPIELTVTRLPSDSRPVFTGFIHDISERKRTETALRESEERFRVAAEISSDLVYEWDLETGEVLYLHSRSASARALPHKREDWEKLVHPDDRERVIASVRRTLETDQAFFEEYRIVIPDGSMRVRVGYGKVLRDPRGRALKWVGVNKDVTDQRQTETALRDSEQKLRTLVANMPVVMFAIDREGIFTHSEGKGLEALGLKPGEVVGRSAWELYRKYPDILDHLRRALSGDAHTATVRLGEVAFETRYAPYRDVEGRVVGVIGVATDVTEQHRSEQALRSSESRYRTLFERNLAGVFRATPDGQILDCNESFARIFGYSSPAEALHHPALDFYLRPADRKVFLTRLSERHNVTNH